MKAKLLLIIMTLSVTFNLNAQSYKDLWKDVNKNLESRLPESAESFLDKIEQKAIAENNQKELLKSFLYRFRIFNQKDENPIETSIKFAEENIGRLQEPEKSIFNVAIASLYESYLDDNFFNVNRQQTTVNSDELDMEFWDVKTFERVIDKHYENALADVTSLQNTTSKSYQDVLAINETDTKFDYNIEPTIYDYVLHKIIKHQIRKSLNCTDLYQDLIDFDKKNNYNDAAIYNEIYKLKYEYETYEDYESYLNSLIKIKNENLDNPLVTSVMALQAEAVLSQQTTVNGQQITKDESIYETALKICDEAIKLYPNSIGAEQCNSIRSNILRKELELTMQSVVLPNQDISASISYRNLTNPHYRIYKLSQNELNDLDDRSAMDLVKAILKKKHIIENKIDIPEKNDYQFHSMNISLPKLECGTYFILFSNDDKFSNKIDNLPAYHSFQVSRLSYVTTKENEDFMVYVLDRESGLPVKDVNVNIFKRSYNYNKNKYDNTTIKDLTTDENGIVKVPNVGQNAFHINLSKDNDMLLSDSYFHNYQNDYKGKLRQETIFFTDRAIYRPGQTVYYKGIIINKNSEIKELVVGAETVIYIKDSNGEEISSHTFTTNEFGSFDGSFVIPNNLSNGFFKISNVTGSIYVKVEEYKRPTFEITFNAPDKSFKLNEEVELNGSVKAYAGFGLDNVNYNYTIERRAYFPYRFWWFANYDNTKKQIAFGEGNTDANGNFNINFELLTDKSIKDRLPVYEYLITVNATNSQGETQTKTYTIKASDIDLIIDVNKEYKNVSIDSLEHISFNVKNLKENPVEAKIIRKIYEVKDNGQQTTDNRTLIYEDVVNVKGESKLFPNVKKLIDKGRYVVELISADNEKAMTSIELTVIDYNSSKMPYNTMCISYYDKESAQPDDNVNFYLGSSAKDVNVYVMIKHGDEVRYYERKTISDKVLKIKYKVKEEDRGNISLQAFFVKDNTINIVEHNIAVPYNNLDLDIRLDVVRDDLLPGSEEKWNLTIKDYKDNGVVANLLAGMYDASLDAFAENHWYFNTRPSIKTSTSARSDGGFNDFKCWTFNQYPKTYDLFVCYLLSDIDLIPITRFTFSAQDIMLMPARAKNAIAAKVGGVNNNDDDDIMEYRIADEEVTESTQEEESQIVESQEMSIRENFNETAFFYPNLITNEDGSLTFSFTMPDALTRWNLMMLAYTKDLKVGTLNKTFTTSKPLMIMSDMPRFVYENDTLWVVANVIKTTDNSQQSTDDWQKAKDKRQKSIAKLEIFDALTMDPLDIILSEQEIAIDEISAGNSKSVRWKVAINNNTNLLAMRFSVSAEDFSDAEQHLLPILSNEVFMTETYPLIARENSEKSFDFDFQNENERNYGLTLNICANPIWYAIQSLPYLSQETGQYADAAFNIFYANSIASYIAHNIPNLLDYIKKWELETPDALMSALQKDENLKAIMLQETPWVMEAKSEAEQKAMLANLFDISTLRNKTDETLNLIKEKQSVNGGWSWFPNMLESPFITQYILGGFGRLYKMDVINSLTQSQQEYSDIISRDAIKYLCNDIIKNYDLYKDYKNISNLSTINELYALSFFDFNEDIKYKTAKNFFIKQLKEGWHKFNFGTQAKIALVLYRNGDKDITQLILKSLKERARKNENLGMYWSSNVSEHSIIMEAFKEINPDEKLLNEMGMWLLCNKRTNMWENAQMTVDAVYALVFDETTRLQDNKTTSIEDNTGLHVEIKNDNDSSDFMNQYFWNSEEMKDFKDIKVNNETDNLIWGGLFRQYFVSLDEVRKHETPLKVDRNIYVERINKEGTYLVPIEDVDIKVGDKIVVNLNIESSQDMEFVFLKDMRAACLEPVEQMSRYRYQDGMLYYQSNSDTFMGFYFDRLPKGKHQVSYSMFVTKEGNFSNGYALIQCMYAPEFSAYSEGNRIKVINQ